MNETLSSWFHFSFFVLKLNYYLVIQNLFLAVIPLILSVWLFRWPQWAWSGLWWLVFVIFIAFLPNAPYILTDIIHLIRQIQWNYNVPVEILSLVLVPGFFLFLLAGFEAYVISLINLGYYLHQHKLSRYINRAEMITHALSSVGIYLGRYLRFNSWDVITKPHTLARDTFDSLTDHYPLLVIGVCFLIITVLYWIMKQVNLGLVLRWKLHFKQSNKLDLGISRRGNNRV